MRSTDSFVKKDDAAGPGTSRDPLPQLVRCHTYCVERSYCPCGDLETGRRNLFPQEDILVTHRRAEMVRPVPRNALEGFRRCVHLAPRAPGTGKAEPPGMGVGVNSDLVAFPGGSAHEARMVSCP